MYGHCDHGDVLLDLMLALDLDQVVNECTRANAVLDLLFIGQHFSSGEIRVEPGVFDHSLLSFCCDANSVISATDNRVAYVKDYARCNDNDIIDYLGATLENESNSDVESMWTRLKDAVEYCLEHFVPTRAVRTRRKNPWVTRQVMHLKRKLKRLRKHRHISPQPWNDLKKLLAGKLSEAKTYYHNVALPEFIKSDPHKFWRHLGKATDKVEEIMLGGKRVTEPQIIADSFNNFFYSVFTIDSMHTESKHVRDDTNVPMVAVEVVVSMLRKLSNKKGPGPDGLPNAFLNRFSDQLGLALAKLFKVSLNSGEVPSDWKKARVVTRKGISY